MPRLFAFACVTACLAGVVSCANSPSTPLTGAGGLQGGSQAAHSGSPTATAAASGRPENGGPRIDPASVAANELGLVPVLMYHRIVTDPSDVYERTPHDFRAELERLARGGYVPVTAAAYVSGEINIPAGKHPVVLTFDDSTHDQFRFDSPDGRPGDASNPSTAGSAHPSTTGSTPRPAPDSAVGILLSVAKEYPDFRPVATFFVNRNPFALPDGGVKGLTWLDEHGFEIGNHTYTHANLGDLHATGVQRQLAKLHRALTSAVPGADVTMMALPMGVRPDRPELAAHGSWHGVSYDYDGVFLVGARPAPSPHDEDFDPLAIPRIRAQGLEGPGAKYGSTHWLNYLEAHPDERYTSDGDPARVSFPEGKSDELPGDFAGNANPY